MNKTILRDLIQTFKAGSTIQVQMRGRVVEPYTVIATKKGKGKGGSWSATIQRADGTVIEIGTPRNLDVLNITSNDVFYGVSDEREEPPVYSTNEAQATNLKLVFQGLLGDQGVGLRVEMESPVAQFQGAFLVKGAYREKGKYGQIRLVLTPETVGQDMTVEVWSFRHSGVITSFQVGQK